MTSRLSLSLSFQVMPSTPLQFVSHLGKYTNKTKKFRNFLSSRTQPSFYLFRQSFFYLSCRLSFYFLFYLFDFLSTCNAHSEGRHRSFPPLVFLCVCSITNLHFSTISSQGDFFFSFTNEIGRRNFVVRLVFFSFVGN